MEKLKVLDKVNNNYVLQYNNGAKIDLVLEFHCGKSLEVGDYFVINDNLSNHTFYAYGQLDDNSGRVIESECDKDLVCIIKNDEKIILKRLYG